MYESLYDCTIHDMLCVASTSFGLLKNVDFYCFLRLRDRPDNQPTNRQTLILRCEDASKNVNIVKVDYNVILKFVFLIIYKS